MKIPAELKKQFDEQITLELEASTVYRQLAIEVDVLNLPGMASWLRHQADEEIVHANKFIDHLTDRGDHPQIGAIAAPKVATNLTPLDVFTAAYKHEQKVSEAIRNLYRAAEQIGDLDCRPLLSWFLEEQIEEESTVDEIVGRIELIGDDGPGLLRLDAELGARPAQTTEATAG
ncbi:MAG TPA: ferritin [Propionibacteriaceae bacterium]|nr:ferritin [Propionibacteriaceae bacterium]HPZ49126.1 ferritin [Propionibacteriaceae bacterium]HQE31903.1 ferritin [Propionibacteriaceae bacterium]